MVAKRAQRRLLRAFLCALLMAALAEVCAAKRIMCETEDSRTVMCQGTEYKSEDRDIPGSSQFWWHCATCTFLVFFAGAMSGLTIGLLSMDITSLMVLKNSGEPQERVYAARIIPMVEHKHLLLVTLLLCNAAAMEALPIFLDEMVPSYMAIILSVTAVLFFGELVKFLMFVCFAIAWPISKLLDWILGEETANLYGRGELKELVYLHGQTRQDANEQLTKDEITIIKGAMDMATKTVKDAMTSLDNVYSIDIDATLDRELLTEILDSGHSRIPIYQGERERIVGGMLVKQLVLIDPDDNTPVRDVMKYTMHVVTHDLPLYEMLNQFQTGKSHLAVVKDKDSGRVIGIITLEDVIEELINEEIVDETDVYVDMESRVYVVRPKQELQRRPSLLRVPGVYALATTRAGLSRSESAAAVGSSDQANAVARSPSRPSALAGRPVRSVASTTGVRLAPPEAQGTDYIQHSYTPTTALTRQAQSTPQASWEVGSPVTGERTPLLNSNSAQELWR